MQRGRTRRGLTWPDFLFLFFFSLVSWYAPDATGRVASILERVALWLVAESRVFVCSFRRGHGLYIGRHPSYPFTTVKTLSILKIGAHMVCMLRVWNVRVQFIKLAIFFFFFETGECIPRMLFFGCTIIVFLRSNFRTLVTSFFFF